MTLPVATQPYNYRLLALAVLTALAGLILVPHRPVVAASTVQSADSVSYVLFASGSRSSSMSGAAEDLRRARELRSSLEGLLYVRYEGAAYVIRDGQMLRQARLIVEPQEALGAQQAKLGSRQAAIGERQAALGQRQAQLGAEQARLGLQQASASPGRQLDLGRQLGALGEQQAELGRQQAALGQQQDPLGRQQAAYGREQVRLARVAQAKFSALLRAAIQRKVAQRVN